MCDTIRPFAVEKTTDDRISHSEKQKMKIKNTKKSPVAKTVIKKCAGSKSCAKKSAKAADEKSITFTVHAEKGKQVYLAGEFNQWNPTAKKMTYKPTDGIYTATITLTPGTYQYKFVIDGTWCADPENADAVPNDQGTFNSVIEVK